MNSSKFVIFEITRVFLKVLFPFLFVYYFTWQSVSFANLNREIHKLTQKKEELFKKNYDLKAKIAATYASERVENLFKQKYESKIGYQKDRVITLTLPENKFGYMNSE
ncbi:MAG: hypothetical protein N3A69_01220 [Leptospiraceae bacterium]|nr:hypothetical protein [Leptospiraceae bacterium]